MKEIMNFRAEINEKLKRSMKLSILFERINKINKLLARLAKKK
jgi:hypothetical protein